MVDGQGRGWFFRKRILCAREYSHGIFVLFLFVVLVLEEEKELWGSEW